MGRYLYKGREIEMAAKKALKEIKRNISRIGEYNDGDTFIVNDTTGQGEIAIVLAVAYPDSKVFVKVYSEDSEAIIKGCIRDFAPNVRITKELDISSLPGNYHFIG